jgi:malate:Na+ symporter
MKIIGIDIKYFTVLCLLVFGGVYLNVLPTGMVGSFAFMMLLGAVLNRIGNNLPIVKDYLGGGPIVIIFMSAALIYFKILPEYTGTIASSFMKQEGFLSFYIASLITGSILGMNRQVLINAAIKYIPLLILGVCGAILFCGIGGLVSGYGFKKAVFFICIPIMGGGMGAGAVPLAQIFSQSLNTTPKEMMSVMVPALALGNALAIIIAGLINKFGAIFPKLNGRGKLLKNQQEMKLDEIVPYRTTYQELGIGLIIACSFFIFGKMLGKFIEIHPYALMIISVAVVKVFNLIPKKYENCASEWFQFVMINFTPALLVGIGIAYTDLGAVVNSFSLLYLLLVFLTLLGAILGTGIAGYFMGFYPIEASITAGLCMANMGGTGDVAVLSACGRMQLIPFAQISSRIGGALILILATVIIKMCT